MQVVKLTEDERNGFLANRGLAVLSTHNASGQPLSVPVWYAWDGKTLRMFSVRSGPQARTIAQGRTRERAR